MPTTDEVQNTILSGEWKLANIVLVNTNDEANGCTNVDWFNAWQFYLNIQAVQRQLNLNDLTSAEFLQVYDCLRNLIGIDPNVNVIDPNYQPPNGNIVVINPASYEPPIPYIPYTDFDPVTQQPDLGRYIYYQPNWKGLNPVLSLISPSETALTLGVDYVLLPQGGISLLSTSTVLPFIYPGQAIRATSYVLA